MADACEDCGRANRRGGRWCSRCYQYRYRADPARRAAHRAAVARYAKRNPAKRRSWVRNSLQRTGTYVSRGIAYAVIPTDVRELWRSLRRIEAALAHTA